MNKRFALWPVNIRGNFCIVAVLMATATTHCLSTIVDNLLAPEKRATNPSSSDIINGFSLGSDNHYNEFQSDSSANDNTANATNLTCAMSVVSEVNGCR
jgi:hypothetical protein